MKSVALRTCAIAIALAALAVGGLERTPFTAVRAAPAAEIIVVNGAVLPPAASASISGRAYVALRPAGEAVGAVVHYDAKHQQVTLTTVLREVVFRIGVAQMAVNGETRKIEAPALLVNGTVMLPLRALSDALDATIKTDNAKHQIQLVMSANPAGVGAPTPPPIRQNNTLEGTVVTVDAAAEIPSVVIDASGMTYTITVPANTKVQFRDTHGTVAGDGTLAQVRPGDTLIATLDSQGRVFSVADVFSGASGTIASVAGMSMVLTSGKVVAADATGTTVTLDGRPATLADLKAGNIVTVRSDPKTGKVREIVAFTPGGPSQPQAATPMPNAAGGASVVIQSVSDNADHPFRLGQSVQVAIDGTPGGSASFDLSNVILDTPMRETRAGHYEGAYTVQIGTNLVDAPILIKLSKGSDVAHAVGPDPLTVITDAPQVKETAPTAGARINTTRPSIYVTFATLGGKGMNANSLQLTVDGKDVTAQATRTAAFISYFPASDLHEGSIAVEVKGIDVAGNPLDYSWSFVIATR